MEGMKACCVAISTLRVSRPHKLSMDALPVAGSVQLPLVCRTLGWFRVSLASVEPTRGLQTSGDNSVKIKRLWKRNVSVTVSSS